MKYRNYLVIGFASITTLYMIQQSCANQGSRSFQPYIGLSGGLNMLSGYRSEEVDNAAIPATFVFSNKARLNSTNFQGSVYGGAIWNVTHTSFFLGPEVFWGRSDTEKNLRLALFDPNTNFNRVLDSTISQSYFVGASLKAGINFVKKYSAHIILGQEISRFQNRVTYVPESNGGGIPDDPPGFFQSRKWLNGFFLGFGLEKQVDNIKFGINYRVINYSRFKASFPYPLKEESINNIFTLKNARLSLTISYNF